MNPATTRLAAPCAALAVLAVAATLPARAADEGKPQLMPVTLHQCIQMAERSSLALRQDEIAVRIAKAEIGRALGAFDTVAFFNGDYQKSITPSASSLEGGFGNIAVIGLLNESYRINTGFRGTLVNGASYVADANWSESFRDPAPFSLFNPTYTADFGLTVVQPLLRGFGTTVAKSEVLQARNALAGTAEGLEESRLLRAAEVVIAYWNFYFAQRTLETREFLVEQADRLLRINRKREEVGDLTRLDVIEAESELASRQQELITAQNEIERTADVLRRLIFPFDDQEQWNLQLVPLTETSEAAVEPPPWVEAARVALERRPELRRRREFLKNNDIEIVVAENSILPRLDLTASARFAQLSDSKGTVLNFEEDFYSLGAGVSLEVPLGNRAARYGLAAARLRKLQALIEYKDAENAIIQGVRDGVRDVINQRKEFEAAREAVRLAAERWEAEQKRQEVGYSTTFQVRDAQAQWREAKDAELQALFNYQIALGQLHFSQGTLLEEYGILPAPRPTLDDRAGLFFGE